MGKVIVKVKLTNVGDLVLQDAKALKGRPRAAQVEMLVDPGATNLCLRPSVIKALGLKKCHDAKSRTANGVRAAKVYWPARLELMGRAGGFNGAETDETAPNRLGQIPLAHLDFIVDPKRRRLIPNPEHGGEWMTELY